MPDLEEAINLAQEGLFENTFSERLLCSVGVFLFFGLSFSWFCASSIAPEGNVLHIVYILKNEWPVIMAVALIAVIACFFMAPKDTKFEMNIWYVGCNAVYEGIHVCGVIWILQFLHEQEADEILGMAFLMLVICSLLLSRLFSSQNCASTIMFLVAAFDLVTIYVPIIYYPLMVAFVSTVFFINAYSNKLDHLRIFAKILTQAPNLRRRTAAAMPTQQPNPPNHRNPQHAVTNSIMMGASQQQANHNIRLRGRLSRELNKCSFNSPELACF